MPILSKFPGGGGTGGGGITLSPVTDITTLTASGKVYIKWNDPEDLVLADTTLAEWGGTLLVRKAGSMPASRRDGTVILDNIVRDKYVNEYFCDSGLTNGITYYYKFFPYSTVGAYTESVNCEFTATPNAQVEGIDEWVVTNMSVAEEAGNGKMIVKWTDPAATLTVDGVNLATWGSTTIVVKEGSYPTSKNDAGAVYTKKVTARNQYATNGLTVTGLTDGTTYYIGFYPETTDGGVNTSESQRVTGVANRITIETVPTQSGTLTYNSNTQSPTWNNYDTAKMTIGGTTTGINAGEYTATFTPNADYRWGPMYSDIPIQMPISKIWLKPVYGNGKFVATANGFDKAAYSTDGITWELADLPKSASWQTPAYGNGMFVTVASGTASAAYSTDGITWTATTIPSSKYWQSPAYGNGVFVTITSEGSVAYSTDGITWNTGTTLSSSSSSVYWRPPAYGNGVFVTVDGVNLSAAYSTDGITWTSTTIPLSYCSAVTYGNDKFVAVADSFGSAAYSTDGITWTKTSMPSSKSWNAVSHGNGKFIAVARSSTASAYSADGITWTETTMPEKASNKNWSAPTYGDGKFVTVLSSDTAVAYSYDGVNWITTYKAIDETADRTVSQDVDWSIGKAAGSLTLSSSSITLNSDKKSDTVTVTRVGDGAITATSSNTGVATVSVSGTTITINSVNDASGEATITVSAAETTNYTAPASKTISVEAKFLPTVGTALNDCTWDEISAVSTAGLGSSYWSLGDCKAITINGSIGAELTLSNATYYVFILGFDHNGATNAIDFGTFKTALTNGVDVCLYGSKYNQVLTGGYKYFNLNHYNESNYGGWKGTDLRYDILGSTDVAPVGYGGAFASNRAGYDATATCATNPVAGTLMAALPSDLRAVMKPMTIYTDNKGGGSNDAANVTASIDYLPLISPIELVGVSNSSSYVNSAEQNYQKQYAYYAAGNYTSKWKDANKTGGLASCWLRSPQRHDITLGINTSTQFQVAGRSVNGCQGLAPIFRV